ncbi:MAG TPA: GAF domain-containing protein, partial [Gaiellaceae bacterium]
MRTPTELSTVRALGRAAAAVLLLPAVLRRGTGPARRAGTTREFESVSRVADELARTADVEGVARMLLDEIAELFDVGFAALTFVSEDGHEAAGYLARADGEDVDWWPELRLDLEREPSGIASAVFEATAMTVYDTASSGVVSRRLADKVGAKSAAFVPLLVEERVTAVISVATLDEPRVFSSENLGVMQTLAAEAAVALERLRAGVELEEALKRNEEQLAQQSALLRAAHVLSSELDLPVVLQRLADQLAQLLDADAADCYLLERDRGVFRCVAVHGFDSSLLGFEFPMSQGLAGAAVREGRPLVESAYGEISVPVPHPAYDGFSDAIAAPLFWSDEVGGVLGVGRREGRRFAERDASILEAFAGLASLALR